MRVRPLPSKTIADECRSTASCAAFGVNGTASAGEISTNSVCVADPSPSAFLTTPADAAVNPQFGFCGYVGATCGTDLDCVRRTLCAARLTLQDYGTCTNGQCRGYFGDTCSSTDNSIGCLGTFALRLSML